MARNVAEALAPALGGPALEVKGTITPVTVICLRSIDVERIERELKARVDPAPQLFLNAPVVIDVADVDPNAGRLPLAEIVARVRQCRMVPIGVAHLSPEQVGLAAEVGLAIVQLGFGKSRGARANSSAPVVSRRRRNTQQQPAARAAQRRRPPAPRRRRRAARRERRAVGLDPDGEPAGAWRPGGLLAARRSRRLRPRQRRRHRSIADGHVHVYGRLRGRALAGARGNDRGARLLPEPGGGVDRRRRRVPDRRRYPQGAPGTTGTGLPGEGGAVKVAPL